QAVCGCKHPLIAGRTLLSDLTYRRRARLSAEPRRSPERLALHPTTILRRRAMPCGLTSSFPRRGKILAVRRPACTRCAHWGALAALFVLATVNATAHRAGVGSNP